MALFKGALAKEGKGVEKNEKKSPIVLFFEIYFRKFWNICQVSIFYLIGCIPTFIVASWVCGNLTDVIINDSLVNSIVNQAVPMDGIDIMAVVELFKMLMTAVFTLFLTALWGMGPVTAGYTYILRNYSREEHAWPWSDFLEFTGKNFMQALVVWLVDMVAFWLLINAFMFYASAFMFYASILKYLIACVLLAYTLMHFYIYPLMVTYKLKLREIYKYSFLFAVVSLPSNLMVLLLTAVIHLGMVFIGIKIPFLANSVGYWTIYAILELLVLQGTTGFLKNYVAQRTIQKYMKGEEKKETSSKKNEDNDNKYLI